MNNRQNNSKLHPKTRNLPLHRPHDPHQRHKPHPEKEQHRLKSPSSSLPILPHAIEKKSSQPQTQYDTNYGMQCMQLYPIETEIPSKQQDNQTTQQSTQQHLSYGDYQFEQSETFRRKNVRFQEHQQTINQSRQSNSSRQSSILKNSSRLLDRSLVSSERSISIQNSFTAVRKSKLLSRNSVLSTNQIVKHKYEAIVLALRDKPNMYTNDEFPPVNASVFNTSIHKKTTLPKKKEEIVWKRISDLYSHKKIKLISNQLVNYRVQLFEKSLGQCYLKDTFNAIRKNNHLLQHIFEHQTQASPFGIYLLKIYQQNSWRYVIVDDWIPCIKRKSKTKEKYQPAFMSVVSSQKDEIVIWPYLLEKAYASYASSYENLLIGNLYDFLGEVMGTTASEYHFQNQQINPQKAIEQICKDLMDDGIVVLGQNQKGLCFALSCMDDKEGQSDENIITFIDSTDNHIYKFDGDQLPIMFEYVYSFRFMFYPNHLTCSVYPPKTLKKPVKPSPRLRLMQIPPNDTTSLRTFTLNSTSRCSIDIRQKDNRFYYQCGIQSYLWVRALLLEREYNGGMRWIRGKYSNNKHITFQQVLQAGEYHVIVMVEWREKHNREITVELKSEVQVQALERGQYNPNDRIIELACMDIAQRCGKFAQINKSICSYSYLNEATGLIIENIVNERTNGEVTIMRSIAGLKSKVDIIPINGDFEVELDNNYGEKCNKALGSDIELDIGVGQSYTVVLRMRGGIDRKFFKIFNFS